MLRTYYPQIKFTDHCLKAQRKINVTNIIY